MGDIGRGAGALGVHLACVVVKAPDSEPCSTQAAPGRRTSSGPQGWRQYMAAPSDPCSYINPPK
eukprot:4157153-Heterocapsa_arctica.AAC.1